MTDSITQRMYRALLGAQTTQQSAQAAAHVAGQLLIEQQGMTQATLDGSLDDMKAAVWDEAIDAAAAQGTPTNPYRKIGTNQ